MRSCDEAVVALMIPVLDQSPIAFALINKNQKVVYFNQGAERLWGYSCDEVLGEHCSLLIPPAVYHPYHCHLDSGAYRNFLLQRKGNEKVWVSLYFSGTSIEGAEHTLLLAIRSEQETEFNSLVRVLMGSFEHSHRAMAMLDHEQRLIRVNQAFMDLLGHDQAYLLNRKITTILHGADDGASRGPSLEQLRWGYESLHLDARALTSSGQEKWLRITSSPGVTDSDRLLGAYSLCFFYDITEERQMRNLERDVLQALTGRLGFSQLGDFLCERIRKMAPEITPCLLLINDKGYILDWSSTQLPAQIRQSLLGPGRKLVPEHCWGNVLDGVPAICTNIAQPGCFEEQSAAARGSGLLASWAYPLMHRDGSLSGMVVFYSSGAREPGGFHETIIESCRHLCMLAIEREENRRRTEHLVMFDSLTGLPNRVRLRQYITQLIEQRADPVSVLTLGLDGFRVINEGLGHDVGDEVLLVVASRLQALLASEEMLSHHEGDLFVFVLPHCDALGALRKAEQYQAAVSDPIKIRGSRLQITACIGVAVQAKDMGVDELRENSKKAMYEAKKAGQGTYSFFNPDMNRQAQERLHMGNALQRSLTEGRLRLHYQPQVHLVDGRLHGFETLARWQDPAFGNISPARFVPLAEEIGEIQRLGRWALEEACRQLAAWRASGIQVPAISVNLSARSFRDRSLPDYVNSLLGRHALQGKDLTVEITESTAMALSPDMLRVVHDLRELGIGLSMDDFGTGYSSLSGIAGLPVTEVKIDRSFIGRVLQDERLYSLVMAVIGIGQSLGLKVVAEGVETRAQCRLLRDLGADIIAQGFLFSRPMPAHKVPDWLAEVRDPAAWV